MHISYRKRFFLIFCLVLLLTGCKSDNSSGNQSAILQSGVSIDLEKLNSSSKLDGEIWPEMAEVADTGRGLYFFQTDGQDAILCYYDYQSQKSICVCNRPDCSHSHTDENCNARFCLDYPKEFYDFYAVQWYDNALYFPLVRDGKRVLCRISADGSSREEVTELFDVEINTVTDGSSTTTGSYKSLPILLHRGYVYFIVNEGKVEKIYRKKLEKGSKMERVSTSDEEGTLTYRMQPYGEYLFFQEGTADDDYTDIRISLYAYDTENSIVTEIKKDIISAYTIDENILYYSLSGEGIYAYDLRTGEENLKVKREGDSYQIKKVDNGFIVTATLDEMVFDNDGNLLRSISNQQGGVVTYVNKERMVSYSSDENGNSCFRVTDISNEDPYQWTWGNAIVE